MRRWMRLILVLICLGALAKNVFGDASTWSVTLFFGSLAGWYWLTWKRTRELDAEPPR